MILPNRSFFRCNLERERCQSGDLTLDVEYEDKCDAANDGIEFEAIEAEGDSEDPVCSGQRFLFCKQAASGLFSPKNAPISSPSGDLYRVSLMVEEKVMLKPNWDIPLTNGAAGQLQ